MLLSCVVIVGKFNVFNLVVLLFVVCLCSWFLVVVFSGKDGFDGIYPP